MNVHREDEFHDFAGDSMTVCMTADGDGVAVWYTDEHSATVHLDPDTAIAMASRMIAIAMELKEPVNG